jgi:hypothetical protein
MFHVELINRLWISLWITLAFRINGFGEKMGVINIFTGPTTTIFSWCKILLKRRIDVEDCRLLA